MALIAEFLINRSPSMSLVLDVAPAGALSALIRERASRRYVSVDFNPGADGRDIDVQASLTQLPIRTGSVGFMLCSHVLEHIPDDQQAISEIVRVLGAESSVLIQVPRRRGAATDEDVSLSSDQRLERYGQSDHVRLYGDDFEARLRQAGLRVATTSYSKLLPSPLLSRIGVFSDHELWIASTDGDPEKLFDPDQMMTSLSYALLAADSGGRHADVGRIDQLEQELEAARADALAWKSHYEWLRNRPLVRTMAWLKRATIRPFKRGA